MTVDNSDPTALAIIDVSSGMTRWLDDGAFYAESIRLFIDKYNRFSVLINDQIEVSNFREARKLAHSVKGAAGTLSLPALEYTASQLEHRLIDELNREKETLTEVTIQECQANFTHALENVLSHSERLIQVFLEEGANINGVSKQ